jgi:hypothetical protein
VEAIKTKIPDISVEWLMFGIGSMYISHPEQSDQGVVEVQNQGQEPMINFDSPAPSVSQVPQNPVSATSFSQGVKSTHPGIIPEEIKIIDKAPRKVTEIRVYYDDQTYETFVPAKK